MQRHNMLASPLAAVHGLFQGDSEALQLFDRFFAEVVDGSDEVRGDCTPGDARRQDYSNARRSSHRRPSTACRTFPGRPTRKSSRRVTLSGRPQRRLPDSVGAKLSRNHVFEEALLSHHLPAPRLPPEQLLLEIETKISQMWPAMQRAQPRPPRSRQQHCVRVIAGRSWASL